MRTAFFDGQFAIGGDRRVGVPEALDRCRGVEVRRPRLREQQRDEIRAILRELEHGFEHQVLHHRLAADVHDEGHGGTDRGDVRQVLLGTDAEVDAARDASLAQHREDPSHFQLIGREVVGDAKETARLGDVRHQAPEFRVAQAVGESTGSPPGTGLLKRPLSEAASPATRRTRAAPRSRRHVSACSTDVVIEPSRQPTL